MKKYVNIGATATSRLSTRLVSKTSFFRAGSGVTAEGSTLDSTRKSGFRILRRIASPTCSSVAIIAITVFAAWTNCWATGKFIRLKTTGNDLRNNLPKGVLAAKLGKNGISFRWEPAINPDSPTRHADLLDGAISPDESVLVIAEQLREKNQKNSTRLVFADLQNGGIINGMEFKERLLSKLLFLTDYPGKILALQTGLNSSVQFLTIDLIKRKIQSESVPLYGKISSFVSKTNLVWYTTFEDNYLHELTIPDLKKSSRKVLLEGPASFLVLGNSGKSLIAIGNKNIQWYEITDEDELVLQENFEMREVKNIQWAEITSEIDKELIFTANSGECYWLSGGSTVLLSKNGTGRGVFHSETKKVILEMNYKNQLLPVDLQSGTTGKAVNPGTLRPASKNDNFKLFSKSASPLEILQLDCRGNIFKLTAFSRRWQKKLLLQSSVAGLR